MNKNVNVSNAEGVAAQDTAEQGASRQGKAGTGTAELRKSRGSGQFRGGGGSDGEGGDGSSEHTERKHRCYPGRFALWHVG